MKSAQRGDSKPLIGGIVPPVKELKSNHVNICYFRNLSILTRNFKNTSLRKSISRVYGCPTDVLHSFKIFWTTLKVIRYVEPDTTRLCYLLLRNAHDIEFQKFYLGALDRFSQSKRFLNRVSFHREEYWNYSDTQVDVIEQLYNLDPEIWIPVTVFPRFTFEKESKMELAFRPVSVKSEEFESAVIGFLRSLNIKFLDIPEPSLLIKVGSSRYNDNGVVKHDYELPVHSLHCGFLYQKFNPKPLQPREVWLPDKITKINNNFWMLVGRSILNRVPYYPDTNPEITWDRIKKKLGYFGYFDLPGYGFQYPREYLSIIAKVICRLYGHQNLFENYEIFNKILDSVKVQMPDGKYKFPPRGIGLGYYEDLKTIGIMALCHYNKIEPISLYGDQGLTKIGDEAKLIKILNSFDFIMDKTRVDSKVVVKWSGRTMTTTSIRRPREYLDPLISSFKSQYHWERKNILRTLSVQFPEVYKRYSKYIPTFYESFFGYEFFKGDSYGNFRNCGVSSLTPPLVGNLRTWSVELLQTPRDTIVDDVIYSTPFFTEWKRSDAKKFSILRKTTYKSSVNGSTIIRDYATPLFTLNKSRTPSLGYLARNISDSMESKILVNYKMTSGRFTFGLSGESLDTALRNCSRAVNPFEAYATGGYTYDTVYRGLSTTSTEWLEFTDLLKSDVSMTYCHRAGFLDSYLEVDSELNSNTGAKRKVHQDMVQDLNPNKGKKYPITRITLSMLSENCHQEVRDDVLAPVTNLSQDMSNRQLFLLPIEEIDSYHDEDLIDYYFDEIE
jgi:hypothetical protein